MKSQGYFFCVLQIYTKSLYSKWNGATAMLLGGWNVSWRFWPWLLYKFGEICTLRLKQSNPNNVKLMIRPSDSILLEAIFKSQEQQLLHNIISDKLHTYRAPTNGIPLRILFYLCKKWLLRDLWQISSTMIFWAFGRIQNDSQLL